MPNKLSYVKGHRSGGDCILCEVQRGRDDNLERLLVYGGKRVFVTLNLYPYNPGHLMVVPRRHVEDVRKLEQAEVLELHAVQGLCMEVLDAEYTPSGYNLGFNVGKGSGASISHVHLHIVPRHRNEVGFFDVLSDARVIVEHPQHSLERLRVTFADKATRRDKAGKSLGK